jgi:hypothetical protein
MVVTMQRPLPRCYEKDMLVREELVGELVIQLEFVSWLVRVR